VRHRRKKDLKAVTARHVARAKAHAPRIVELAGAKAEAHLAKLLNWKSSDGIDPDLSKATKYEKFVAQHRLAISPTIEALDCSLVRWDSLRLPGYPRAAWVTGVPAIFAMVECHEGGLLGSTLPCVPGSHGQMPESGLYADTLDYATYGVTQSIAFLGQRACMDVLDKVAVATTEYFAITTDKGPVYFSNAGSPNARMVSLGLARCAASSYRQRQHGIDRPR